MKTYSNVLKGIGKKAPPVKASQKIPGFEAKMFPNNDGGYSFKVNPETLLDRFLIFGTEGNTYNCSEAKLTIQNTKNIQELLIKDPNLVFKKLEEVSLGGKSFTNDPALYTLALGTAHPDAKIRKYAFDLLPSIARTGTHLFHFIEYMTSVRNWSRMARTGVGNWYTKKSSKDLVYQCLKYQQRDGWSHKDIIRLSHPSTKNVFHNEFFNYIVNDVYPTGVYKEESVGLLAAFTDLKNLPEDYKGFASIAQHISETPGLTQEMVPSRFKKSLEVQAALLKNMPYMATIRNLGSYTASGLIKPFSLEEKLVCSRIENIEQLKKSKTHPLHILMALLTYQQGKGFKGNLTWTPSQKVLVSLEKAFYESFNYVEPSGKNFYVGIDCSGSMGSQVAGKPISSLMFAGAVGMTLARCEPNVYTAGFQDRLIDLKITKNSSLPDVMNMFSTFHTGSTNAGAIIEDAISRKLDVDLFVHITDNDFNSGRQPYQLLKEYQKRMNKPNCKLVSLVTYPSLYMPFPEEDPNCLGIAGFATDAPKMLQIFAGGGGVNPPEDAEEE